MYIYRLFSPVCRHTSLHRYSDDLVDNVLIIWTLIAYPNGTFSYSNMYCMN